MARDNGYVSRYWKAVEASELCLGYWCAICDSIIPKMNFHREHPERCGNE